MTIQDLLDVLNHAKDKTKGIYVIDLSEGDTEDDGFSRIYIEDAEIDRDGEVVAVYNQP